MERSGTVTKTRGGFLISKIKQVQGRVFERLLAAHGIDQFNGAQGRILFVLWEEDNISISDLSERTGLAKTTLTSMLDRLEASGHIQRTSHPDDRRRTNIRLTAAARGMQGPYDEVSRRMSKVFYEGFDDQEIALFERMLERVLDNMTAREATR
ncbi:MAG: MarR family transcriptional regulator [Chloroflexi bacterium]|nr:MarR family transcriptional regulator [Chloroflexota bacterium]